MLPASSDLVNDGKWFMNDVAVCHGIDALRFASHER